MSSSSAVTRETLILSRRDVAALFTLGEYIIAVEDAFRAFAQGQTLAPALMHVDAPKGEFHIKAGGLSYQGQSYFGLKANGGFFGNPSTNGLPGIQGVIYLADADVGSPLAVLDSMQITVQRTGAASAVAAKYLAREDASTVTICGAGKQGRIQLISMCAVRPIARAWIWDRDANQGAQFATEMSRTLGIPVTTVTDIADGTLQSDIVVTCTPSHEPFLGLEDIRPGTFIAAVGADSPDKQEVDVGLLASATVVTDVTAQCAHVGELHHALEAGVMALDDVHAEIGQVIAGMRSGRTATDEVIVYDATGTALQDVACAAAIYLKAVETGRGQRIVFAD